MRKAFSAAIAVLLLLATLISACQPAPTPALPATPPPQAQPVTPPQIPPPQTTPIPPAGLPPTSTADQPAVLASSAESQFPSQLIFRLQASSKAIITDIRLSYTLERESFAQVTAESFVDFAPAQTVVTEWVWDMRKTGGLPTGAIINYWWTVRDAAGGETRTAPAEISFEDKRYTWQSITENMVTIYWYRGEQAFAQDLMAAAQTAMVTLRASTGAVLKKPVKIYIYAHTQDLQGAMIFPQEWAGGVAFTEHGIIAIGIETNNLEWGRRSIAHELTHLVVHQMTNNPYSGLPTWLNEGLSMYNEGSLEANFVNYLKVATLNNALISTRSLSSPFSADSNQSYLSYAESYSLVEYLVTTHGQDKMLDLLNTFSQGASYDGALKKVYGFDLDGLNTLWRDYANRKYGRGGQTTALPARARPGWER